MSLRLALSLFLACLMVLTCGRSESVQGCACAPPSGKPVVNADQTVIIIWDAATKTQHFIRQASFKSDAGDFGFLVPTPNQPELAESGNDAFPHLRQITEPERITKPRPWGPPVSLGCSTTASLAAPALPPVRVLDEKLVAGFNARVLEADSPTALLTWLNANGYAFSPEVEVWAKPYVEAGWKITALKVAKSNGDEGNRTVAASSLRLSFKTDWPLFPYREPDPTQAAAALGARQRLLRIYFLSDARYEGELTKEEPWTGRTVWAGQLNRAQRSRVLELLGLSADTGPAHWWLTEFEDAWPYKPAPADVYFHPAKEQKPVQREPIIDYVFGPGPVDVSLGALAALVLVTPLLSRLRRRRR